MVREPLWTSYCAEVVVPVELLQQRQRTQRTFDIVLPVIAGISLLVGGIGILNIMLAGSSGSRVGEWV